jgi:orotate phosphoribosyltransferase
MMSEKRKKLFEISGKEIYQYREQPFQLSSGGTSNHYFNCRKITLIPERLLLLSEIIRDEILPEAQVTDFDSIGGLTMGADPIVFAVSLSMLNLNRNVYPLIVRKEAKGHGLGHKIEGEFSNSKKLILIDDVVTTAGSGIKALEAFRESGIAVDYAVCVIDREEGGSEALALKGVRLLSVFKKSDFF